MARLRGWLAWLFLTNEQPRRLRVGWRLTAQFIVAFVLVVGAMIAAVWFRLLTHLEATHLLMVLQAIAITLSVWLCRKLLDRKSFVSLGLKVNSRAAADFLIGALISGIAFSVIFAFAWAEGVIAVNGLTVNLPQLALWLGLWFLVGWYEEIWMRGYWLQNIAEASNLTVGVILSSVFFGLLHAGNPNATVLGVFNIMLAGLYLAWGYVRTRSLWLPIGLHFGWNLFEGTVFGFPVSGTAPYTMLKISVGGAPWLTGGAFGPEGGVLAWAIMLLGALLVWWWTRERTLEAQKA